MKNILSRILLSLATLVFCVLFLEIAMAIVIPKSEPKLETDRSKQFFRVENSRKNPYAIHTQPCTNINVFGDSFTEGAGVLEVDTFSRKLEYLLNMNDTDESIIVHNRGRSGRSTYQRVRHLRNLMNQDPDVVILQITLNDTEDWDDASKFREWRKDTMPKPPTGFTKFLSKHSRFVCFVNSKMASLSAQKGFITYYENLYNPEYSGWKKFEKAIADFGTICAENDTKLFAVIFPLLSHNLHEMAYPFHPFHQQIHQELEANNIKYIDLFDTFEGLDHNRLQAIPHIDPHPSEIAHRMAAEAIMYSLFEGNIIHQKHFPKNVGQKDIHQRWIKTFEKMNPPITEKKE